MCGRMGKNIKGNGLMELNVAQECGKVIKEIVILGNGEMEK